MSEPLILVTNDDGITSHGIAALREAAKDLGRVVVIAPETEKSAVGHAITLSSPIRIQELSKEDGVTGFAVGGTPADCVKLAVRALLDRTPDLILSGINHGANVGMSLMYSGTVSAATEGVILGIPSIAISLDSWTSDDFNFAGKIAKQLAETIEKLEAVKGDAAVQRKILSKVSALIKSAYRNVEKLEDELEKAHRISDAFKRATAFRDKVFNVMNALRKDIDGLETMFPGNYGQFQRMRIFCLNCNLSGRVPITYKVGD